ncbi:MAG: hypothetical protein H7321_07845 [Bacteroidia bacterium]|nr:hypothetical protein [Bacteroidia bacterium]
MVKSLSLSLFIICVTQVYAQNNVAGGQLSGNFQSNTQFYDRDAKIGATTEVYNKYKSSTDAWLFLNYGIKGYNFSLRYDLYNNSPLLNPQGVYNKQGIGFWQASKDIDKLNVTVGYFYDQFASGMIFRAYEDRLIGIDFAIQGLRMKYEVNKNLHLKGFAGQQKGNIFSSDRFAVSPQAIRGFNAENRFDISDNFKIDVGASVVNRTLDQGTMNGVVTQINSQLLKDRFIPKYNTYSWNGYATVAYKDFRLYGEYVQKSSEAINNQEGNKLINKGGNVVFGSLSWSKAFPKLKRKPSFGANVQYKRIDNFRFRTSPFETLLNGMIAYLPSITRQNTYRLLARYNAVVQDLGEEAFQAEAIITPKRFTNITINYSRVNSLQSNGINGVAIKLFREYYLEVQHRFSTKFKVKAGFQAVFYNQQRYEVKDFTYPNVTTLTPFTEITYKLTKKRSLRLEAQYLDTKQDLGSFVNLIVEMNVAPSYSLSIGDMVNIKPHRSPSSTIPSEITHYYSAFGSYTYHASVFSLAYIKQVQGVNCTGGICRIEPAFSGVRFSVSTSF